MIDKIRVDISDIDSHLSIVLPKVKSYGNGQLGIGSSYGHESEAANEYGCNFIPGTLAIKLPRTLEDALIWVFASDFFS